MSLIKMKILRNASTASFFFCAFLLANVCSQTSPSSTETTTDAGSTTPIVGLSSSESSITASGPTSSPLTSTTTDSTTSINSSSSSESTITTPSPTTTREQLSVNSNLRVFWVSLGIEIPLTQNLNDTGFRALIEDRLLELVTDANARAAAKARRRKRAAVRGNLAVQLVSLTREGSTKKVNAVFYVRENNSPVSAALVASNLNLLTSQEKSITMKYPVNDAAAAVDTRLATTADQRVWIVGAVLGTLGAVVIIVWLVLFIYARCLRPQPPSLLDVEAPTGTDFKMPYQDDPTGPGAVYHRGHVVLSSGRRNGAPLLPVKSEAMAVEEDDEDQGYNEPVSKTTNLDFEQIADEVVRRLDRKMTRMVERKLDSRTESMRDARRMTIPSPSEDSVPEESTSEARRRREPKAKARKGRRRKSKMNSVTPSDDDSSLPPLRKPSQYEEEEEEEEDSYEQKKKRRARLRAARDLDRALGIDEEPKKRKSKSKHRRRRDPRSEDEDEEEDSLERARGHTTDLLSDPYTVGDSTRPRRQSNGSITPGNSAAEIPMVSLPTATVRQSKEVPPSREQMVKAEKAAGLNSEPTAASEPEGDLLQPTGAGDSGHQPIRVMTSLRPEALKVAALTSTYSTGDEMERIRPQVEKDLQSQPQVTLDVRGSTPLFARTTPAPSRDSATPVGAFRPVAPASVARPPGQPLPPNTDEADIASAAQSSTSPQPIIDSIREELKRLTARSDA